MTDVVFLLVGPLASHELTMPIEDCFRLEQTNEMLELFVGLLGLLFQSCRKNG